jgi:hypothetical protein
MGQEMNREIELINTKKLYKEIVIEKIGERITSSNLREATKKDIEEEELNHSNGKCQHSVIYDEHQYYMYDFRYCGICGKFIGFI